MQEALDATWSYCNDWDLRINVNKTKIMVFSKGKVRKVGQFSVNNQTLQRVDEFNYLGVVFRYNCTFSSAIKFNVQKAKRAAFQLKKQIVRLGLNVSNSLTLYDRTVLPVLLYGCEIWGFDNIEAVEIFDRNFLRYVLGVDLQTPKVFVYGETGRHNIRITVKERMVGFFLRMRQPSNKLSHRITEYMVKTECADFSWVNSIQDTLNQCGAPWIFNNPRHSSHEHLLSIVKQTLVDMDTQNWSTELADHALCQVYKKYKLHLAQESYLDNLSFKLRRQVSRLRGSFHKLPLVKAFREYEQVEVCPFCEEECMPDEYHLLMICDLFRYSRRENLPGNYLISPSMDKFVQLMSSKDPGTQKVVAELCDFIFSFF